MIPIFSIIGNGKKKEKKYYNLSARFETLIFYLVKPSKSYSYFLTVYQISFSENQREKLKTACHNARKFGLTDKKP